MLIKLLDEKTIDKITKEIEGKIKRNRSNILSKIQSEHKKNKHKENNFLMCKESCEKYLTDLRKHGKEVSEYLDKLKEY